MIAYFDKRGTNIEDIKIPSCLVGSFDKAIETYEKMDKIELWNRLTNR